MNASALDLSNWDGEISAETVSAFRAAGITDAIVGCQNEAIAREQIRALRAGGVRVLAVYLYCYFGFNGSHGTSDLIAREVLKALRVAADLSIGFVALDCEGQDNRADVTPAERLEDLARAYELVTAAGRRPIIYTAPYFWREQMGDSQAYLECPLWLADYFTDGRVTTAIDIAGGHWRVAINQNSSTDVIAGRDRDHDVVLVDFEQEDQDMATLAELVAITVGNGIDAIATTDTLELFPAGTVAGATVRLTGDNAFAYAVRQGWSLGLGLGQVRAALAGLASAHADVGNSAAQAAAAIRAFADVLEGVSHA